MLNLLSSQNETFNIGQSLIDSFITLTSNSVFGAIISSTLPLNLYCLYTPCNTCGQKKKDIWFEIEDNTCIECIGFFFFFNYYCFI